MKTIRKRNMVAAVLVASVTFTSVAWAEEGASSSEDSSAELAKKLQNPVADLISVPMKLDWDTGIGPAPRPPRCSAWSR